ncbi:MAG: thiamine ABC transporter substrate-binding protein, partial [Spirochaetota bacterium]
QKFIDFIITEDFQSEIPLTNWMYPINPKVKTPDSFRYAPKPEKSLSLDPEEIKENQERWIRQWLQMITR